MKINEQLFEDVLSGKLKGTFVLRNGIRFDSIQCCRNVIDYHTSHPYRLRDDIHNFSYKSNGLYSTDNREFDLDIVDFIPEINMETKVFKIEIPEGFEIDKENSSFEKIVFKKKDVTKPKSWEEYLCSGNHPNKLWFINPTYKSAGGIKATEGDLRDFDLNKSACHMSAYLPSEELAEAFLAMMQLMSLRQAWIGDWNPDWKGVDYKYCIIICCNNLQVNTAQHTRSSLSFPTKEMVEDFMKCFKDLLEIAKPLI